VTGALERGGDRPGLAEVVLDGDLEGDGTHHPR
jgi:hypothetical protein